jgi:hypothetical protein
MTGNVSGLREVACRIAVGVRHTLKRLVPEKMKPTGIRLSAPCLAVASCETTRDLLLCPALQM